MTVGKKTEGWRETGKTAAEGLALAQIVSKDPREVGLEIEIEKEIIAAGILVNAVVTLQNGGIVTLVTVEAAEMNAIAREMKIIPTRGNRLLRDAL